MNDLQQYLVDEFVEDYAEGHMTRRDALQRIAAITGSLAVATSMLAACGSPAETTTQASAAASGTTQASEAAATAPSAAGSAAPSGSAGASGSAQASTGPTATPQVAANDPDIEASGVQFPGGDATLMGYLARPKGDGPFPIVLVCHENRGLTPHIEDVTRRLAKAGYIGMAVDLLSREGGTAKVGDPAQVPGLLGNAPPERMVQDFQNGLKYVQSQPYAQKDRVGMVGFCFGGGITWRVATKTPELRAAVPFYGPPPPATDVPSINAAVLAIYAERDQRINASIPDIEAAMKQNNKTYEKQIYPGVDHAFHNDTGQRYNAEAAKDAWAKTLAWFDKYVKA